MTMTKRGRQGVTCKVGSDGAKEEKGVSGPPLPKQGDSVVTACKVTDRILWMLVTAPSRIRYTRCTQLAYMELCSSCLYITCIPTSLLYSIATCRPEQVPVLS